MFVLKDMKFFVNKDNLKVLVEKDRRAEASLSGFSMVRFIGAVFVAGYRIEGFEKEKIGKVLVELDKIRVYRKEENNKTDRVFEKFTEDELITIASYLQKEIELDEIVFSLKNKEGDFNYSVNISKQQLAVFDNKAMNMKAVDLNEFLILRIKSIIELATLGLLKNPVVIKGKENNILISEAVIPEVDLDDTHKQNVNKIIDISKQKNLNQYSLLRQYYKQQNIPYTRKIILKVGKGKDKITVHLPVSFAFAIKVFFEKNVQSIAHF